MTVEGGHRSATVLMSGPQVSAFDCRFISCAIILFAQLIHRFNDCLGLASNGTFGIVRLQCLSAAGLIFVDFLPLHHPIVLLGCVLECLNGCSKSLI